MTFNTVFHLCWQRESAPGHLEADLGTPVPADRLELALMGLGADHTGRGGPEPNIHRLEVSHILGALQSLDRVQSLPKWLGWRLTEFFGPLKSEQRVAEARDHFAILSAACDRIRRTAGARPWVELYLPYFSRQDWNNRFAAFAAMNFELRNGWVQSCEGADPLSLEDIVQRVSAAVFQPASAHELPLRFQISEASDNRRFLQPWLGLLASRWGFSMLPNSPVYQSIDLQLPSRAAEGWRRSPRQHHGRHHVVWPRVALAVQWILRRWNLALQTSTVEGLQDSESLHQAMLFHALRPWAENARSELSYDVLDEKMMNEQFQRAVPRLETALEQMPVAMDAAGLPDAADSYRAVEPADLAARIAARGLRNKAVRGMLAAEAALINALIRYSGEVKAAATPREVRKATENLTSAFREQLPRILRGNRSPYIDSAIFLEATAAMYAAVCGDPQLDVAIVDEFGGRWQSRPDPVEPAA